MNNNNKQNKENPSELVQLERLIKSLWHRKQESTTSNALWNIIISFQFIMVGIFAVLNNIKGINVSKESVQVVFWYTIAIFVFISLLHITYRILVGWRAKFFEKRIFGEFNGQDTERTKKDNRYKCAMCCYSYYQIVIELACATLVVGTILQFVKTIN